MFIKYPKIHRLGSDENDGILIGKCYIQEKIDGANTSIWMEDGEIKCASRNNELTGGFNGFVDYAKSHVGIKLLLADHPNYRLFGEWLVRHTISYKETAYKQFYLFDILMDGEYEGERVKGIWLDIATVTDIAAQYDILAPTLFDIVENPNEEHIKTFVGTSTLGDKGEGITIKNFDFVNKWGACEYAKIVTENFKEDNAVVFGGNNKHSDTYWEMYICNKYMTLGRVQKVVNKLQAVIEEKMGMKDIPRVMGTAYHDLVTEEAWEIAKKVPALDYKTLQRVCYKKARQIYVDILNDNISVADQDPLGIKEFMSKPQ